MAIIWRPQMSVGNDLIDADHRYLISLINMVDLSLRYNDDFFTVALEQLIEYTHDHFKREELIQLKVKYPGYAEHKIAHQELISSLEVLVNKLTKVKAKLDVATPEQTAAEPEATDAEVAAPEVAEAAEFDGVEPETVKSEAAEIDAVESTKEVIPEVIQRDKDIDELIKLLRAWIIDHLIGTDMKMKPYLKDL